MTRSDASFSSNPVGNLTINSSKNMKLRHKIWRSTIIRHIRQSVYYGEISMKYSILHNKGGKGIRLGSQLTCMYFETVFFTSSVVYTIFHHALDGKCKVRQVPLAARLHLGSQLTCTSRHPYFTSILSNDHIILLH